MKPLQLIVTTSILLCVVVVLGVLFFVSDHIEYKDTEPAAVISPTATELEKSKPLETMVFLGDIMLGRHVEVLGTRHGTSYLTEKIRAQTATSTHVIANFESAMNEPHIPTVSGGMRFSTKASMLPVLTELRVTHASLANNHALDYGVSGYKNTIEQLKSKDITPFGHPTLLSSSSITYLEHNEQTIALIGIHTLFVEPTKGAIETVLAEASQNSDFQIIYVHWGNEYELVHSQRQATLAAVMVESGADLIVGHHSHVTQDIQFIDDVLVFYSLGNFIFDQYFSTDVKEGYILDVTLTNSTSTIKILPHTQIGKSQTEPMQGIQKSDYLESLADRSDPRLSDQIKAGNIAITR